MSKINWGNTGSKIYETGIDRAVLFVNNQEPISWNGLISVSNNPTGGEISEFYYDGIKYLNSANRQEFKATIKAYTIPNEFNTCNGIVEPYNGLLTTNQEKTNFNLTYRTKIGNDNENLDFGYKIHLIYEASSQIPNQEYLTISETSNLVINEITITAKPQIVTGYVPTAYRVVDTRNYSVEIINTLEEKLYGTDTTDPSFPTALELTNLLNGV